MQQQLVESKSTMGIFRRLFGSHKGTGAAIPVSPDIKEATPKVEINVNLGAVFVAGPRTNDQGLIKLTGTTTFGKEAITALAGRHGITDDGYLEISGKIKREPDNKADPMAVAVYIEAERIGYLPGWFAQHLVSCF